MLKPWTCPKCGKYFAKLCGVGTHRKYCDPLADVEAFWAKVQRGASDACWPFMGARVPAGGYGRAWMNKKLVAAHRIAYMCAKGNIPEGLDVIHSCDNPPCCNPAHLKAATTLENMADMQRKGRDVYRGEKNHHALLTDAQAAEIRAKFKRESFHKTNAGELAAEYRVPRGCILAIGRGATYRRVP